jgi:hypothetical protein
MEAEEETIEARTVTRAETGAVVADASMKGAVASLMEEAKVEVVDATATRRVEEEERQEHSTELLLIDTIHGMNTQPSHRKTRRSSLTYEMQEMPCMESVQLTLLQLCKRGN